MIIIMKNLSEKADTEKIYMAKASVIENKILRIVRDSTQPPTPDQVVNKIAKDDGSAKVRDIIVSLVDRGKLLVTLDWKLRAREEIR
jgi:hypothetical protein